MRFEFDPAKNQRNIEKHGVDMALVSEFDFDVAVIRIDQRRDYTETRYQALGYLAGRLHSVVFTMRLDVFRVISLRKASKQERRLYDQNQE